MAIRFSCPHCAADILVRDEAAGKSGSCRTCGKRFQVPGERAPRSGEPEEDVERTSDREEAAASLRGRRFNVTVSAKADVPQEDLEQFDRTVRKHLRNSDAFRQVDLRVTIEVYDHGSRLLRYIFPLLPGAAARVRIAIAGTLNGSPIERKIGVSRHIGLFGGSSQPMVDECLRVATADVLLAFDRAIGRAVSSFGQVWMAVQIGNVILAVITVAVYAPAYYQYKLTIPHPFVRSTSFEAISAFVAGLICAVGVVGLTSSFALLFAPRQFYLEEARGNRIMAMLGAKSVIAARAAALVLALLASGVLAFAIWAYFDRS